MLIRFAVSNFLSFRERAVFSMHAGKFTRHLGHVREQGGHKILRGGFVFGANAGGKSNFIRAINFAKKIVLEGLGNVNTTNKYFRLDASYKEMPGVFQFDITAGSHVYSYGFAISWTDGKIIEEWLTQLDENREIFTRKIQNNNEVTFSNGIDFKSPEQENRFNVYADDIKKEKMRSTLFLSDILPRITNESEYTPFLDVATWFTKLIVIFPDSKYSGLIHINRIKEYKDYMERCLRHFDTGIDSVVMKDVVFDEAFKDMPEKLKEKIKKDFAKLNKENEGDDVSMLIPMKGMLSEVKYKEGNLVASKLLINHGNNNDLFEFGDESDGTKRLFNLIPLFWKVMADNVVVVDELDRSLHTKLTLEFIKRFYEISENADSCGQLIATTHDCNILDLDLLRQDEIWFVERGKHQASDFVPLSRFKERFDKKIEKDYLLGRYGAIPIFASLDRLEPEFGEKNDL